MSQIQVSKLSFCYEGSDDMIFENVSFRLDTDWRLGFVGRNGKGKTTFLRLLMGQEQYEGSISASVVFDYFPYLIEDKRENTIAIVEKLCPQYELWRVCMELEELRTDAGVLYRPFDTLSNGEQTKVMLALLFSAGNHFLLIDEPTNHLDGPTRLLVREYLRGKKGFILVSHDRELLDACTDHVLALEKNNITVCQGNFSTWWENKQRRDAFELAQNQKLKQEIGRLTEAARRSGRWADAVESTKIGRKSEKYEKNIDTRAYVGEKSRRMQMRRKNLERRQQRAIDEKSELLHNIDTVEQVRLFPLVHHKRTLVTFEDVGFAYEEGRPLLEHFSLKIQAGERIALTGKNGCGKTTVLKLILKELQPQSGLVEQAGGLIVSHVAQDTSFLTGGLREFMEKNGLEESLFKAILRKLDFERAQFEKAMEDYSEGQKKKVLIAASLCQKAHLYVWDEPLNFIDIFSRMQIEELILTCQPTMIFVEHDAVFTEKIATWLANLEKKADNRIETQ